MEAISDFLQANPLYAAGGAVLLLLVLFTLLKKMFKLALFAVLLTLGYLYYVNGLAGDSYRKAGAKLESATEKAGELVDKAEKLIHD